MIPTVGVPLQCTHMVMGQFHSGNGPSEDTQECTPKATSIIMT